MSAMVESIVEARQGKVRGSVEQGVHAFRGVPFAAPPFGPNRLLPPQQVEPWSGVRDALVYGPKSPQPAYPPFVATILPEYSVSGEDCLNLNVWTPDPGRSGLPVMVWIAGGLFEYHGTGASPWSEGARFARDGVVCVTINYRVGAEGFLYLGEDNANRGLLDQLAALEWVRDNIAAFGGDPDNVTVFGESAGGLSIGTLLSMPRAEGLFRRAVIESGGAHHVSSIATSQRVGGRLAELLGVELTGEAIAAVPVERVLQAQEALRGELMTQPDPARWGIEVVTTNLPWQPAIDGVVVPARPIDRIASGAGAGIDLIAGSNVEEWRLFLMPDAINQIPSEMLIGTVTAYGLPVEATIAAYRAADPNAGPGDLFAAIQGDWYFRIPTLRIAEAHATGAGATYCYEFAWRSPQFGGRLGACHALEIAFAFDNLGNATEPLMGPEPPQGLADTMHAAWVAFARTGDPGWPRFDLDRRATMRFDASSAVVEDPGAGKRTVWEGVR